MLIRIPSKKMLSDIVNPCENPSFLFYVCSYEMKSGIQTIFRKKQERLFQSCKRTQVEKKPKEAQKDSI